jgi:GTP cyclohydrolase II
MNTPIAASGLAHCHLPTPWGTFDLHALRDAAGLEHAAVSCGDLTADAPVLTRLHSECLTGDVFASLRCDCGAQLDAALQAIAAAGRGVVLYLRQEGRGIGLVNKIRAYALQEAGADTVEANRLLGLPDDARDYRIAGELLRGLGVQRVRLMTNNPAKLAALAATGIEVVERVPVHIAPNRHNRGYLLTKVSRMGHLAAPATPDEPDGPDTLDPIEQDEHDAPTGRG